MKNLFLYLVLVLIQSSVSGQNPVSNPESKGYSSWLPAPDADHAMLLGNGTMGAMVFGHPHNETIILNHAGLYLPTGLPKQPIDQYSRLAEIRQLILEGLGEEAAKIPVEQSLAEGYGGQQWSDPYIPAFDLKINTTPANIKNYQRSVNFESGEATVSWEQEGNRFLRQQFISRADSVMVIRISASNPFDAEFLFARRPIAWNQWDYINSNIKNTHIKSENKHLFYQSEFVHQWEGNIAGYAGIGKIVANQGKVESENNGLKVYKTREILFLLKIESYKTGESFQTEQILRTLNALEPDYQRLLSAHKKIHSELFNRVSLDLNGNKEDKNLDSEVMMQEAKKRFSPAFVEKQFYAARYNILSATGKNLPNLQGIWGSSMQPPWSSDYTHDGNLPVAISSFLSSNMPELMNSFFDYHDARLPYYRDNAQKLYGCRGIQVPSHSSSHGWNVHFDPTWCLSFWNGGAAWTAHFYYDYWLYTNDKKFLLERAYPFMKEAALFYEDFLTPGTDGKWVFNPSYSPENNPANHPSQATINATMDVMLAKELFRNLLNAGKIVKEDKNQLKKWETLLSQMPDYELDSTGTLREWLWPGYQENHKHRHLSHMYGMYDQMDPELVAKPELINGVKKVLDERMNVRRNENGGIMVFGLVQMAWVAANLGDDALTEEILHWLSANYWSNSLATYHDPNGLFNMDLSGGFQTAVIRSLVYSEPEYLWIFPAKPSSWETGSISGIKARKQLTIEKLSWQKGEVKLILRSPIEQKIKLKLPINTQAVFAAGKALKTDKQKNQVWIKIEPQTAVNLTVLLN
ncbi:MAG: glycoside hydrolase N-terminal domain-containing protein [Salinivirgaceae bacterium]